MTPNQVNECCKIYLQSGLKECFKEILLDFESKYSELLLEANINLVRNLFACYLTKFAGSEMRTAGSEMRTEPSEPPTARCGGEVAPSEFVCEICDKWFATQNGLNAHKKIHKL